jgi:DNA-binding NtrC family response regulator
MESMQQKTILIIETHQALQALYEAELQEEGFNTLLASSNTEAQQLLDSNSVDLLMSDLPGRRVVEMSSLALLAKDHNIPLLINTGYPLSMIDRSAIRSAVHIQEKSSDIDKLKDKIRELLGNAQRTPQSLHGNRGQQAIAGKFDGRAKNHQPPLSFAGSGLG